MNDRSIRLAVIGFARDVEPWREVIARSDGGRLALEGDSAMAALQDHAEEFDAVIGNILDMETVTALTAAGKHLLLAAPGAATLGDFEMLQAAVEDAGVHFDLFNRLQFTPEVEAIRRPLEEGKLGTPGLLRVHRWRCERPFLPTEMFFADIDLAVSLFNTSPSEIYAVDRTDNSGWIEYLQVHLGFPAGGMALLDFTNVLSGKQGYDSLSLIGSTGAAYADDHHNTHLFFQDGYPAALISPSTSHHLVVELQRFLDGLLHGPDAVPERDDYRVTHQVVEAIFASLGTKAALQRRGEQYERA